MEPPLGWSPRGALDLPGETIRLETTRPFDIEAVVARIAVNG